jgi:hypothetical protein
VFALKRDRAQQFTAAVSACGPYAARKVGSFHGDGHEIDLFRIEPAPPGA